MIFINTPLIYFEAVYQALGRNATQYSISLNNARERGQQT